MEKFNNVTFKVVDSVIGSGYEDRVTELALHDKVAYRAARKNMQKHSIRKSSMPMKSVSWLWMAA